MEKKRNQISFQFNDRKEEKLEPIEQLKDRLNKDGLNKQSTVSSMDEFASRSPGLPSSYYKKRRKKNTWAEAGYVRSPKSNVISKIKTSTKVFLTAGAAIVVGLLLGMMVLSIFSNLSTEETTTAGGMNGGLAADKKQSDIHKGGGSTGDSSGGISDGTLGDIPQSEETDAGQGEPVIMPSGQVQGNSLELPARSYFVVQAGAFSEESAGKRIIEEYKQKGWPGLLLGEEAPYRLYIGMSQTKEGAMLLGRYYQEQDVQIYVKEHLTPSVPQVEVQAKEDVLKLLPTFLAKGDQLLAKLGKISSSGIMDDEYQLTLAEWNEVQELHRRFLQDGKQLFTNWVGDEKRFGEQMIRHLTTGVNVLETFRKQRHNSYLWQVQQASLQYVKEYEQMVSSFVNTSR